MFYYTWVEETTVFNPKIHLRHDESVISLEMIHEETQHCRLTLVVPSKKSIDLAKRWIILSYKDGQDMVVLFHGQLESYTHYADVSELNFKAISKIDWDQINKNILKHTPYHEFFHADTKIEHLLDSHPYIPHFSRIKGSFFLSPIRTGVKKEKFSSKDLLDFECTHISDKIRSVNFNLKIKRLIMSEIMADLFPAIAKKCFSDCIETYTPIGIKKSWPRAGSFLGSSGYRIISSELKEDQTSSLHIPKFQKTAEKKAFQKKRFTGTLVVSKTRAIKREETGSAEVYLSNTGKPLNVEISLRKMSCYPRVWIPFNHYKIEDTIIRNGTMYVCTQEHWAERFKPTYWKKSDELQELWDSLNHEKFFKSSLGKKLFLQGFKKAQKITLEKSCTHLVRVSLCDPRVLFLTLDDSVQLTDTLLKNPGKICKYVLKADSKGWKVDLNLKQYADYTNPHTLKWDIEEEHQKISKSPEKIKEDKTVEDIPEDLVSNLERLIHQISIHNSAKDQEEILKKADQEGNPVGLENLNTKIIVTFTDSAIEEVPFQTTFLNNSGLLTHLDANKDLEQEKELFAKH